MEHGVSQSMQKILQRDREANIVFLPATQTGFSSPALWNG